MGSPFNIIFYAADSLQAKLHAAACFKLVDSLNAILSDYDPQSEMNLLAEKAGKDEWINVSPVLSGVLQLSALAWQKSRGAVDVTVGPLSKLWRQARKTKQFPDHREVLKAKEGAGFEFVLLDTARCRVKLLNSKTQLDFGAIAKGYIAQKVLEHLRSRNIDKALVDAGGDIAMSGAPPGKKGWSVAVNIPESEELLPRRITLSNKAVATSGDLYQYMEKDGKKYSHIIDPSTGFGVLHRRNVTVIADDGAQADWLATACSILSVRKAKKLVRKEKASLLIAEWKKGKLVFYSYNGFEKYYE
jgi:FAD:protein FMN transferase